MIYDILASKPHNPHYLRRYYNFILECKSEGRTEDHHICPKAKDLFPEYASFIDHPWNRKQLSVRQHYVAHMLLWKAYGGSQTYAFHLMHTGNSRQERKCTSSRMYAKVNEEVVSKLSEKLVGNKWNVGKPHSKERRERAAAGNRQKVSVDGEIFSSRQEVAERFGINRAVVCRRIGSPKFPTWVLLGRPGQKIN